MLREGGYSAERRAKDSTLRITSTEGLKELSKVLWAEARSTSGERVRVVFCKEGRGRESGYTLWLRVRKPTCVVQGLSRSTSGLPIDKAALCVPSCMILKSAP